MFISVSTYAISITASTLFVNPFWIFCRTLSRCQFNSHLRRGVHGERNRATRRITDSASMCGKGRNGRIGFAIVFPVMGVGRGESTCLSPFLSFVCYRVIILRWTKTHYRNINSVLVPLSLRPFYQILL